MSTQATTKTETELLDEMAKTLHKLHRDFILVGGVFMLIAVPMLLCAGYSLFIGIGWR